MSRGDKLLVDHFPQEVDELGFLLDPALREVFLLDFGLGLWEGGEDLEDVGVVQDGDGVFDVDHLVVVEVL